VVVVMMIMPAQATVRSDLILVNRLRNYDIVIELFALAIPQS